MRASSPVRLCATLALAFTAQNAAASYDARCPPAPLRPAGEIFVAWVTNPRVTNDTRLGPLRVLVALGAAPIETDGSALRDGMKFWPALHPALPPATVRDASSFLDEIGADHCVYHADFSEGPFKRFTLFASEPGSGLRAPTRGESAEFLRLSMANGRQAPVERSRLLAVRQGETLEYWAAEPLDSDTGLSVWVKRGPELIRILHVCPGCSD